MSTRAYRPRVACVVVERCKEVGHPLCPLRLHLHPIGRPHDDEKKRASPGYENANGRANVQRDPRRLADAAKVATGSSMGHSPSVRAYSGYVGTPCTERLVGCSSGPAAAPGAFPTLPGPDIVEPVAAAATALAAFAEATGMATFDAEFGVGAGSCFALFVGVRGEDF